VEFKASALGVLYFFWFSNGVWESIQRCESHSQMEFWNDRTRENGILEREKNAIKYHFQSNVGFSPQTVNVTMLRPLQFYSSIFLMLFHSLKSAFSI
jgi:hypothetical protein